MGAGGLSPRGRGKHGPIPHAGNTVGSIPAWAGETNRKRLVMRAQAVYPRVGGGNYPPTPSIYRMRGLSPRGRGKLARRPLLTRRYRSIPAWAGETATSTDTRLCEKVYPRVGGGNRRNGRLQWSLIGLSPRGRGKRLAGYSKGVGWRSIPAWAGETLIMQALEGAKGVYPRVGGGNEYITAGEAARRGLSPRGRGKRVEDVEKSIVVGSIPAWAGETARIHANTDGLPVYPRVGGGNEKVGDLVNHRRGLSPRGRGKPC